MTECIARKDKQIRVARQHSQISLLLGKYPICTLNVFCCKDKVLTLMPHLHYNNNRPVPKVVVALKGSKYTGKYVSTKIAKTF